MRYEKGEEFPAFVELARRYTALGVSFLAFSLDDDPELLDAYLGPDQLPFDRQMIARGEPGSIGRAFAAEGIRVPPKAATPQTVVFGPDGQRLGEVSQMGGTRQIERWLRRLGFTAE